MSNVNNLIITRIEFDKQNLLKQKQFEKDYLFNLNKTNLDKMKKPKPPIYPDIKDKKKYDLDIKLYEQLKMIKDIQRSNLKLVLKKYKITKI